VAADRTRPARRQFLRAGLALAGLGVLVGCGGALPGTPWLPKVRRIGYLSPDPPPGPSLGTFVQGLRDLGYVEGQNLEIVYRWAEGREERLAALAAELVGLPVEMIVARGAVGLQAAQDATHTIPIVGTSNDPVAAGLVDGLARPGGNVTGLSLATPLISAKRVQLLKEAVPASRRLAVLGYAASTTLQRDWQEAQDAAQQERLELARYDVGSAADLAAAFATLVGTGAEALLILQNRFFLLNQAPLLNLVAQHRLPMMADNRTAVAEGGLMSYGADADDLVRRSAAYVDQILKGAKPSDLPIQQPTKFDLVINLTTAGALGLTIPPSVLQQATEVIQ
jgi:ABC-type uncharacterized transport system substrate-binding protein